MPIDDATRELVKDCLERAKQGDACAPFDLASAFMSHADDNDVGMTLAAVEMLAVVASQKGCPEAATFLTAQWPQMRDVLRKRWARKGMTDQG
jgi:hypothetical protein